MNTAFWQPSLWIDVWDCTNISLGYPPRKGRLRSYDLPSGWPIERCRGACLRLSVACMNRFNGKVRLKSGHVFSYCELLLYNASFFSMVSFLCLACASLLTRVSSVWSKLLLHDKLLDLVDNFCIRSKSAGGHCLMSFGRVFAASCRCFKLVCRVVDRGSFRLVFACA